MSDITSITDLEARAAVVAGLRAWRLGGWVAYRAVAVPEPEDAADGPGRA
jgi:hypothetical protein